MTTNEFVTLLETNAELPLLFEYQRGEYVRADYHITEIKNVHFDTVDCGGVPNEWQEVHVQLWESAIPQPTHRVNTSKALKIFQSVNKVRDTWSEVELKVEYGNRHFHTAILPISGVEILQDKLIVNLTNEQTTCKAIDRAASSVTAAVAACCSPTEQTAVAEPITEMAELAVADDSSCCTPGGGCC